MFLRIFCDSPFTTQYTSKKAKLPYVDKVFFKKSHNEIHGEYLGIEKNRLKDKITIIKINKKY
jgi:hypothetical protein